MSKPDTTTPTDGSTNAEQSTDELTDYEQADLLQTEVEDAFGGNDAVEEIEVSVGSQTGASVQFKVDNGSLYRTFFEQLDDVQYSEMRVAMTMTGCTNVVKYRVTLWP
jgi:hypothetical protein